VEKQRRVRNNPTLFSDKVDPASVPIAGVWNNPLGGEEHPGESAEDHIQGGTFLVKVGRETHRRARIPALSFGRAGEN